MQTYCRVEDCNLILKGFLLQIVTWMKSCLVGTHTTSFYIFIMIPYHDLLYLCSCNVCVNFSDFQKFWLITEETFMVKMRTYAINCLPFMLLLKGEHYHFTDNQIIKN